MALIEIFVTILPPVPRLGPPPPALVPAPYVPALPTPPRPEEHVLPVDTHPHPAAPAGHKCAEYGYLPRTSRLKFAARLLPPPIEAKLAAAAAAKAKEWDPRKSVFKPRLTECASKSLFDEDKVMKRAFLVDWGRVVGKERFVRYLSKVMVRSGG